MSKIAPCTGLNSARRTPLSRTVLHRHHKPVVGHLFSIGAEQDGKIVGVAIVRRPVSRHRDDGTCAEVTRLCTGWNEKRLFVPLWRLRSCGVRHRLPEDWDVYSSK